MLRALVAALLLANLVFYAWSQGWLDGVVGARSIGDREPERLGRQVRPDIVRILPPEPASAAASSSMTGSAESTPPATTTTTATAPVVLSCLEAGPFSDTALNAAQAAARNALPDAGLSVVPRTTPAIWMVYMGRYADQEALKKKEEELKRRRLNYEEVRSPPGLTPGLSLGRFDDRNDATKALEQFAQQGIRTARIVEFTPATTGQMLRIDKADATLVGLATGLKLSALGNKGFAPCAAPKPSS